MLSMTSIFLTCVLMFIGGAPGSTAGGFKVTTLFTLILSLKGFLKGDSPIIGKRSIPVDAVKKSLSLLLLSIALCTSVLFILTMTETIPDGFGIEYLMVEVFSCFGTVGLTMGLTPHLSIVGKFLLIMMMFMGRVGLLTVVMSFSNKKKKDGIRYPEGHIMIG